MLLPLSFNNKSKQIVGYRAMGVKGAATLQESGGKSAESGIPREVGTGRKFCNFANRNGLQRQKSTGKWEVQPRVPPSHNKFYNFASKSRLRW